MSSFRTILKLSESLSPIRYEDKLMCLGSCFTEHIGQRLTDHKFQVCLNPFGITYNPLSITRSLEILLSDTLYTEADLFEHKSCWHSPMHHSRFSHPDKAVCLKQINDELITARKHMDQLDVLMLTLGTAHVFHQLRGKGFRPNMPEQIVNNCHQLPANNFERRLVSIREIVKGLEDVLNKIKKRRPALRIILTVSPVRHIRDGLVESKLSKSTLLVAIHQLCKRIADTTYFPAYELVIDDLRDYRFYKEDMVHPNDVAVNYVWKNFSEVYFKEKEQKLMLQIARLRQAMQHRPLQPDSEQHRLFLQQQFEKTSALKKQYPFLDLNEELAYFGSC